MNSTLSDSIRSITTLLSRSCRTLTSTRLAPNKARFSPEMMNMSFRLIPPVRSINRLEIRYLLCNGLNSDVIQSVCCCKFNGPLPNAGANQSLVYSEVTVGSCHGEFTEKQQLKQCIYLGFYSEVETF